MHIIPQPRDESSLLCQLTQLCITLNVGPIRMREHMVFIDTGQRDASITQQQQNLHPYKNQSSYPPFMIKPEWSGTAKMKPRA
jgi:hypothetical protein